MPPALTALFTHSAAGLATLEGPDLRYGYVNVAMQALVGAEALAQRIEEHPGLLPPALLHHLRPVLASGEPAVVAGWQVPAAAGTSPRYLDLHLAPYRETPAGPVAGLLLLALPGHAPLAALPLLDEHAFYLLADSIPALVWLASPVGMVEYYNRFTQQYSGLTVEELGSAGWVGLLHPAEQLLASAQWLRCVATGEDFTGEFRVRRQDSTYRWHYLRARLLTEALPGRWVGTYTDVEDQHRLRQVLYAQYGALAHVHHDLEAIAYTASHDLRQPTLNLRGLLDELRRAAPLPAAEQAQLLHLFEGTLTEMDDALHELTRASQPRSLPGEEAEELDLARVVAEVLLGLRPQVVAYAAVVEVDVAAAPRLHYDQAGLLAVLHNLLRNALQFRAPDRAPHIVVRSYYAAGGQAVLQVQDNGPGLLLTGKMPNFHLFTPSTSPAGGTGVGLYLVQRIVQSQGGHLEVSSPPGQGATSTIYWN